MERKTRSHGLVLEWFECVEIMETNEGFRNHGAVGGRGGNAASQTGP